MARTAQQVFEALSGAKDSQMAMMMARIEELEEKNKALEEKVKQLEDKKSESKEKK